MKRSSFAILCLSGACNLATRPAGTVVIAGVIQVRHSSTHKNQYAKKTSRLFKGDS
jgi:hypothetical protein